LRPKGHVMVSPGKVEIGQGIVTALAQIAADELDVDIGRVQMVRARQRLPVPTRVSPQAAFRCSSRGRAIRQVCAEVRQIFLELRLGSAGCRDRRASKIDDGTISGPRQCQDQLLGNWPMTSLAGSRRDGRALWLKPSTQRNRSGEFGSAAGHSRPRFSPIVVSFTIHRLPGMLHGPRAAIGALGGKNLSTWPEDRRARAVPRPGRHRCVTAIFAGVVSETEDGARGRA